MTVLKRAFLGAILLTFFHGSLYGADNTAAGADPHQQLDRILQQPAYQQWKRQQNAELPDLGVKIPETWGQRVNHTWNAFWNWVGKWFSSRWPSSTPSSGSSAFSLPAVLRVLIIIVIIAAVGLLLFVIIKSVSGDRAAGPTARILSREQLQEALQSGDALALGTVEWMDEARRLAMQQNFRAVYRALYLALLSGLHAAGKIEHNRNRTNWFYVSQYRGPATERTTFSELTDLFDRVWYGRIVAVDGNLDEIRRQIADLTGPGRAT